MVNKCGTCTLCCKLPNMNSIQGVYCNKCTPSKGCSIYEDRPAYCKKFECMYMQMEKVNPKLRPDRCDVLFEKISDNLILATTDKTLVELPLLVNGQVEAFRRDGFSIMIQQFNPHKTLCILGKGGNREEIVALLEAKANDSA